MNCCGICYKDFFPECSQNILCSPSDVIERPPLSMWYIYLLKDFVKYLAYRARIHLQERKEEERKEEEPIWYGRYTLSEIKDSLKRELRVAVLLRFRNVVNVYSFIPEAQRGDDDYYSDYYYGDYDYDDEREDERDDESDYERASGYGSDCCDF